MPSTFVSAWCGCWQSASKKRERLYFASLLARSRASIAEGKGLTDDDFWQAVAERSAPV